MDAETGNEGFFFLFSESNLINGQDFKFLKFILTIHACTTGGAQNEDKIENIILSWGD